MGKAYGGNDYDVPYNPEFNVALDIRRLPFPLGYLERKLRKFNFVLPASCM
jgi:hypothetical protein